jgi:hypothetical protein
VFLDNVYYVNGLNVSMGTAYSCSPPAEPSMNAAVGRGVARKYQRVESHFARHTSLRRFSIPMWHARLFDSLLC